MNGEKGLVLVFTGNGKGKTTAALGLALRAWGQGMRVLMLQFVKGDWETGELKAAAKLDGLEIRSLGIGFVRPKDEEALIRHREAAEKAVTEACSALRAGEHGLVILDEILYALNLGLVTIQDLLTLISSKQEGVHLVLTGRGAPPEILERADLVTEMHAVKHHLQRGIKARKGIEF